MTAAATAAAGSKYFVRRFISLVHTCHAQKRDRETVSTAEAHFTVTRPPAIRAYVSGEYIASHDTGGSA
jgi:hypothetical protein